MKHWRGLVLTVALFASAIVWPHVALWLGSRSPDPYRAERVNMMVDSALGGAWIALMQFNLLPSVAILIMLAIDKMAVGGARFLVRCSAVALAACAATSLATGAGLHPETSMVQIIGALPLIILYPVVVGLTASRLARRVCEQHQLLAGESRTDELSGLLNRRSWEDAMSAAFLRWRTRGGPISLLMLDIDHFKSINDQHGNAVGDEVIRNVAAILRDALRADDIPGRFGGEEFGALLPDTPAAGAEVIAERIRRRIESAALTKSGLHATVSIGIAELSAEDLDHTVGIAHAERALYAAKERGRNRSERFRPNYIARPQPT